MDQRNISVILGCTGMDGSILSRLLVDRGDIVIGVTRRSSVDNTQRLRLLNLYLPCEGFNEIEPNFQLMVGDVTDTSSIANVFDSTLDKYGKIDNIFNTAAQSVTEDTILPIKRANVNGCVKFKTFGEIWHSFSLNNNVKFEDNVEVINVPETNNAYALGYWNGMGTWFKIKQISRHRWCGQVAQISQKFGHVTVTPNHSILDTNNKICKPSDNPWLLSVRKLNYCPVYKKNDYTVRLSYRGCENDEEYFWDKTEIGIKGKIRKKINDDSLLALCRFIGAYISEGWLVYNKHNNAYSVCVCQQDKVWLEELEKDLNKFFVGNRCYCKHKKEKYNDVWRLEIKSKALYKIMSKICGKYSKHKKLPDWFTRLPIKYLKELWKLLYEGDGCVDKRLCLDDTWRYGTTSYKLACQLSWLFTTLRYDYTVHYEENAKNDNWNPCWNFRQCYTYAVNQGENGKKVQYLDYDGWVYDMSISEVNNFAVGVGNIVVHNSHVKVSFSQPILTWNTNAGGVLNLLEIYKNMCPKARFLQCSSSEQYGNNFSTQKENGGKLIKYQNEQTSFSPNSPYAISKLAAFHAVRSYREAYGLWCCSSICFNHCAPLLRGEHFVTRKISKFMADFYIRWIKGQLKLSRTLKGKKTNGWSKGTDVPYGLNNIDKLPLGNLEACRDWGHARCYCEGMISILNHSEPDDFVLATGETHSVMEFLQESFSVIGLPTDKKYIMKFVKIDPKFYRPCEVNYLCGDASKAKKVLGWSPLFTFKDLVKSMVENEIRYKLGQKIDLGI